MRYLVDTDWAIDYMHGNQQVIQRFDDLSQEGTGLSIISLAELYEGVVRARDREDAEQGLQSFLDDVEVLQLDDGVCRKFADERARLRAAGNLIQDLALLIGSTAMCYGLTLLTNNRRHFQRMEGLEIISV